MKNGLGHATAFLAAACAIGCRPGSRLDVPSTTTTPSTLTVPSDSQRPIENSIRTEGRDTVIRFRGKTLIVRDAIGYTAQITPSSMRVQVGAAPIAIALNERDLGVSMPDYQATLTIWKDEGGVLRDLMERRKVILIELPPYLMLEAE
jgi:hypothetical protein